MIEYYPPASPGEWIDAACALFTVLVGLVLFFRPQLALRAGDIESESVQAMARLAVRAHPAGLLIGFGLSALLLQQPLLYLALGISWGFSALGQLLAMLLHKKLSSAYVVTFVVKVAVALLTTLAVLGYFG